MFGTDSRVRVEGLLPVDLLGDFVGVAGTPLLQVGTVCGAGRRPACAVGAAVVAYVSPGSSGAVDSLSQSVGGVAGHTSRTYQPYIDSPLQAPPNA